ncbi:putative E3 ubiquitin-protein ligase LIN-1, partial [Ananas comosus]
MALSTSPSSSSSSPTTTHLPQRLDLHSTHSLVAFVDRHIRRLLSDPAARAALHLACRASLSGPTRGFFEFSDQSVLSNLYWGVESLELAITSGSPEERASRLAGSEKMLQVPALLDEEGRIGGIENRYIVCYSYFYLALVRKLRGDQWQMTMNFLQSVIVFPKLVRTVLATCLWKSLFEDKTTSAGGTEEEADEAARKQGRRYKYWLMYYQVVSYGEIPPWNKKFSACEDREIEPCAHRYRQIPGTRFESSLILSRPNLQHDTQACLVGNGITVDNDKASTSNFKRCGGFAELNDGHSLLKSFDKVFQEEVKENFEMRCLQDMLEESQSDSPISFYSNVDSIEASDSEVHLSHKESSAKIMPIDADLLASKLGERVRASWCTSPECTKFYHESPKYPVHEESFEPNTSYLLSSRSQGSLSNLQNSILDFREVEPYSFKYGVKEETNRESPPRHNLRCFSKMFLKKYSLSELVSRGSFARKIISFSSSEKDWSDGSSTCGKDTQIEISERFEKALKFADSEFEFTNILDLLEGKSEFKYGTIKRDILEQLMDSISTSKKEKVIRASVYILLLLISEDRSILEDIKRKESFLYDLGNALKRNVHEVALLIYLLNPSPLEMKTLEILPALVEVACNSKGLKGLSLLPITPTAASISMIEVLVTSFDYVTNNIHLAAISSLPILSKLVNVAMNNNLEEGVALAAILVRCMRLNGNCKNFLSQVTPVDPFLHLLKRKERRAKFTALEYFYEILQMPRSSAINLLQQIRQQGGISIMHTLMACIRQSDLEHRLLAANLLIQLDILGKSTGKSVFKEEAVEALLESLASGENSSTRALAAFILSNLGGTYSWTGETYTAAWLVRKARLTSICHRNMIRNIDWIDPCLQDSETSTWSARAARGIIKIGTSVFTALAKGMQSKIKNVSHDCLVCASWLGNEMATAGPNDLRYSACEILLGDISRFLHPGSDLDERILACLSVYNYTSGKGKQKLMNFSEGLRESLRRLSPVTWMAEELLKVTDYFIPTKPRVSCVHTQILEVGQAGNGAATAITFFKGQLYAGYSDGTIKAWDIKRQRAVLATEVKEHKKAVTCFALFEPGDNLLSGSCDKSIRVWKTVQGKLECVEVIQMKEPVQKLDSYGDKIIVIMQNRSIKVSHASRSVQTICKNKHVKCVAIAQGRAYLGCADSSIQEIDIMEDNKIEIRAPTKIWRIRKQLINSIQIYKDWMYLAGATVEGSSIKDWRRRRQPQVSIAMSRGVDVQAMAIVEDFIYLNSSRTPMTLQIWLREKQQKVGRLSAGSKITCLLAANDTIFCGTETGSIK